MENRQLTKFTFYDLYGELLEQLEDEAAGRFATLICEYMLTDKEIVPPEDDRENYFWCNIEDILAEDKRIEKSGKIPKTLNAKMRHFTFLERYYKGMKLMHDDDRGVFIKAVCAYMFSGVEMKLKSPVQGYFALAKKTLNLSQTRKRVGTKGGTAARRSPPKVSTGTTEQPPRMSTAQYPNTATVATRAGQTAPSYTVSGTARQTTGMSTAQYPNTATGAARAGQTAPSYTISGTAKQTTEQPPRVRSLDDFLRANPHVENDLGANDKDLLNGKNWEILNECLRAHDGYKHTKSLRSILSHYEEILET